jgi:hypothetical protein
MSRRRVCVGHRVRILRTQTGQVEREKGTDLFPENRDN